MVGLPEIVARVAKSEWDEALDLALSKAIRDWPITFDASWTDMLRR